MNDASRGFQKIYSKDGSRVISDGWWDPKKILSVLDLAIGDGASEFWQGKRVIDIGANSCGLSVEMARRGAHVLAIEPDAHAITRYRAVAEELAQENLALEIRPGTLEDVVKAKMSSDVVLFLGLLYHFKYPQFIVQRLASLQHKYLFISTQCTQRTGLVQVNRLEEMPERFRATMTAMTGWHLSRDLFMQTLVDAGYQNVREGSDARFNFTNTPRELTNSTYMLGTRIESTPCDSDELTELYRYYPR